MFLVHIHRSIFYSCLLVEHIRTNPTTWKGKIKLIDAYSECNNSEAWYNFLVNQLKGYKFPQWNTTFPTMEMTQI